VLALLVIHRLLYHTAYLRDDPFALVPIGDGRTHETAARSIARAFPFGTEPLQLDGLYAYMMALPMSVLPWLAFALLFQLLLASLALWMFHRSACRAWGRLPGSLASALLLAYPTLSFFENKWGASELHVIMAVVALWAFGRALEQVSAARVAVFGAASGVACVAQPWALLALPLSALAVHELGRVHARPSHRLLIAFALGAALAFVPVALRNAHVYGQPELLPRHALSIPLFVGNNAHADGHWNDGGGVIDRARAGGRASLIAGLGMYGGPAAEIDAAIDDALYARAFAFARGEPGAWLSLTARKAWHALGNDERSAQYDLPGERELLGGGYHLGLPFGVIVALGLLGIAALLRSHAAQPEQRTRLHAWSYAICALLVPPVALLLLGFASAENRLPVIVPLCFAAGPALAALARQKQRFTLALRRPELWLAAALCAQAFVPRGGSTAPGAWHYFHLGEVKRRLGDMPGAVSNYARAIDRDPMQPRFLLSQTRLLRLMMAVGPAEHALRRLERLPRPSRDMRAQTRNERKLLEGLKRHFALVALARRASPAPSPTPAPPAADPL
jgi:hypothetical protein